MDPRYFGTVNRRRQIPPNSERLVFAKQLELPRY